MTTRPPFQMVPVGDERNFHMYGNERGLATLTGGNGAVSCETRGSHGGLNRVRLVGESVGSRQLRWQTGRERGSPCLEVAVLPRARLTVAFRLVSDNAGNHTNRAASAIPGIINAASQILSRQANVTLVNAGVESLTIPADLGPTIEDRRGISGEVRALALYRSRTAGATVFFVKDYDHLDVEGGQSGVGYRSLQIAIIKDRLAIGAGLALAHELIHVLGYSGHTAEVGTIMAEGRQTAPGLRMTRNQILAVNPIR